MTTTTAIGIGLLIGIMSGAWIGSTIIRRNVYDALKRERDRIAAFVGDKPRHNWQTGDHVKRQGQIEAIGLAMAIVRSVK